MVIEKQMTLLISPNNKISIPQPIPYQGSKRLIAPTIIKYFPTRLTRVVEPFAGSAAISMYMATHDLSYRFWLNDANRPLIELWDKIINTPQELVDGYTALWNKQIGHERIFFNKIRDRFNIHHDPTDFLYLLARCVKGAIRYNKQGDFNNTPDNRRVGAKPLEMKRRIINTSEIFHRKVQLTSWDYKKVLDACTDNDLVYMDPPYQGTCGYKDHRYFRNFDHDEFCDEIMKLNERNIMFAISYDGKTGNKSYGKPLSRKLNLKRIEIEAGRSTQATLLGKNAITYESLYLSQALVNAKKV